MNGKERIETALSGGIPDRVPYFDFLMSRRFLKETVGRSPSLYRSEEIVPCCLRAELDAAWIPAEGFMGCEYQEGLPERYADEFGTVFRRTPSSWPVNAPVQTAIRNPEELENYRFPPVGNDRTKDVRKAVELAGGQIGVFAGIQGPLRSAWFLYGYKNICYQLADDPLPLTRLFQQSVDFYGEIAGQLKGSGISGIFISEDMGFLTGAFFSADVFRKVIFPYQKMLADAVRSHGLRVILHSDGNLNRILGDLFAMGYDAYHPFERKAQMDIFSVRERYPDAVLFGNIDSKSVLAEGDMEAICRDAKECIEKLGRNGRYVLCSDHSIHDGIDPATIQKLISFVKSEGRYEDREAAKR